MNFIFEVEARIRNNQKTLFIIDDIADSFDYKNKHAIVQYLRDLGKCDSFYQIILTHNFDFFRTLANDFVHRKKCLMANRHNNSHISLSEAEGIKNYFIGVLKPIVGTNDRALCASIPFTRNLIEYTKGQDDSIYLRLTSLLHWKEDTDSITDTDYFVIYNNFFGAKCVGKSKVIKDVLYTEASNILNGVSQSGLNLEDKILLSMAIRMKAEEFLIRKIRLSNNNPGYWCTKNNQFIHLFNKFEQLEPSSPALRTLEKASISVSSNIHLNSFMYEPILDLTIDHLSQLYNEVYRLLEDLFNSGRSANAGPTPSC